MQTGLMLSFLMKLTSRVPTGEIEIETVAKAQDMTL